MTEKLTIKNFGPIVDVTLELRTVNMLIGDQGTGKSTVAKVLAAIKGFFFLYKYPDVGSNEQRMERSINLFNTCLETYGILNYRTPGSSIEFQDKLFHFLFIDGKITIDRQASINESQKEAYNRGYIPASRDAALLLKDELFAFLHSGTTLPKSLTLFGQELVYAKKAKKEYNFTSILDISYKYQSDSDYVVLKNGKEVLIEETSSAINSAVPMLLAFDYFVSSKETPSAFTSYITIEEPELNCFPATQDKLMRYFISKIKIPNVVEDDYYNRLIITTHSPYILTSLNNLIYAYVTGSANYEKTDTVIPAKYWMNPDDVSAYMLLPDGTCEDIFNREENLINADKIDEVSTMLNRDFNKLINIELGITDEEDK